MSTRQGDGRKRQTMNLGAIINNALLFLLAVILSGLLRRKQKDEWWLEEAARRDKVQEGSHHGTPVMKGELAEWSGP